jgi:uncharacterized protein
MRAFGDTIRLSPTDLSTFLGCRHRTGLDLALARGAMDKPHWTDPVAEALRTRGEEHERRLVDALRAQGLSIVDLTGEDSPARTREALASGVDVVVQAPLDGHGWFGYADILRRVDTPSALGAWSYEVSDTKLARETRGGTILQLSVYSELLAGMQGLAPSHFHVVTPPDVTVHTYRADDYAAYYRLMKQALLDMVAREWDVICDAHYPEPVAHCDMCRWWLRCNARRRADDHLSFIAGIARLHREELVTQGCGTLAAAAIELPIAFRPARGAQATYERLREQARLQVAQRQAGRPIYELLDVEPGKGLCRLPEPSAGDLFLDLEGDPFAREGGREYLVGVVETDASCRSWWAFDDAQERAAFEAVIDFIMQRWDAHPAMHVYHFGHYEPSAMKRLMGRHASRAEALDRLLRGERFVDLHAVVRHALRAGVESYSIKQLEPFYAFTRDLPLADAAAHRRTLELALESQAPGLVPGEAKTAVERYNRDDCRSTRALRDWLEQLRAEAAIRTEVPRPTPTDAAPKEKVSALDRDVEALRARLLDGVPADADDRTREQQVRWLLAYLIDWHRREEKADWWEFFRLCELPDDELLDERKAIAELRFTADVDVVRNKKTGRPTGSIIQRYTYPNQEVDLRPGDTLKIQTGEGWGTVETIDRDARVLDVRVNENHAAVHPTCVFAASVVPTEGVQRSVMRLAEAFLEGERSCASDLLFRLTPRLCTGAFAPIAGEHVVDFATRIAPDLERTTLAIQGPPGSGKTYTGARMIGALVARGFRVGVTGPSHKVIRNLLDATLTEAARAHATVRVAQKVTEAAGASVIAEFSDNDAALHALASREADVLGGTPWLWSREEAAGRVDVLFVDEAGQMSLANVLAVSPAATSVVLLGDPQQLDQPATASHPDGIGISALDHVISDAAGLKSRPPHGLTAGLKSRPPYESRPPLAQKTMPPERGLFLPSTWRMAPAICRFTSEVFYEGKLDARAGLELQRLAGAGPFDGAGLWWVPADHSGNQSTSIEEVEMVARIVEQLLSPGVEWIDQHGTARALTADGLRVVAPYNAQVNRIEERIGARGVPVGTVDRFQGQEAPVVIYSMTSSSAEDAPRGMEFLYDLNRLNVATSRARCAVILVASPRLFAPECRTPRQMQLANALCRYRELATVATVSSAAPAS